MQLWRSFLYSSQLPGKKAMFAVNRTGMDWAIIYLCALVGILSIPGFTSSEQFDFGLNFAFRLIYFFIFYYIPLLLMLISALSVISWIAQLLAKWQKRKFRFQSLWKLSVHVATWPILLCTALSFIPVTTSVLVIGSCLFILLQLEIMIRHYPERRVKKS